MGETTYSQLKKFGRAVRARRSALGYSQEDFAEHCGLHRTYMGEVERGEVNVSFQNITRIAQALRIKTSALFAFAGL